MAQFARRVVTGHDASGKSIVISDGAPPQHHPMQGAAIGADFIEMWSVPTAIPMLTDSEPREPNEREFTIMPQIGHLLRIIDIYPPQQGGKRTVMHRTRTLDYVVVIQGEIVLVLDDSEVTLRSSVPSCSICYPNHWISCASGLAGRLPGLCGIIETAPQSAAQSCRVFAAITHLKMSSIRHMSREAPRKEIRCRSIYIILGPSACA